MIQNNQSRSKRLSKLVGVSVQELRSLARDGQLKAERDTDGSWIFDTDYALEYFNVQIPENSTIDRGTLNIPFNVDDFAPNFDNHGHEFTKFVDDSTFLNEVLGRIAKAKSCVWISTGVLRKFQISSTKDSRAKIQFIEYLNLLANKGITIKLLYSELSAGMDGLIESLAIDSHFKTIKCIRNHSKIVIVDNEFVYIGSANITRAGIGQLASNRGNFECGIISNVTSIVNDAAKYFELIWGPIACEGCHRQGNCEYF